jgi:AAA family ATP:ADP antiporter
LEESWPDSLEPIATLAENWIIVLVFIFGEMYGTIVLSLLFWGFANDICTVHEAKRFYPLISLIANVALVLLGILSHHLTNSGIILFVANESLKTNKDLFLQIALGTVIVLGLVVAYIFKW